MHCELRRHKTCRNKRGVLCLKFITAGSMSELLSFVITRAKLSRFTKNIVMWGSILDRPLLLVAIILICFGQEQMPYVVPLS